MARGRTGSLAAGLLVAVVAAACSPGGAEPTSTSSLEPATTSTMATTTTTDLSPTTTVEARTGSTVELEDIDAEIGLPEGEGPFPAVVLLHGGGWVAGGPEVMAPLARHLNRNGFLTVSARYSLSSLSSPGFPGAVDDVACAVRFAASHEMSDGTVAVVGHSAGAHLGAIVALTGDRYTDACPYAGSGLPERFVGLAGPYDVTRLGLAIIVFFGDGPTANPEAWLAGNPQALTDENPGLDALIMYGELDGLVDDRFAFDFHEALTDSGATSAIEQIEGARHSDLLDPELVGDLIVVWLER